MNFRLMEFPEGPFSSLAVDFGARIYYMSMYVGCAAVLWTRVSQRWNCDGGKTKRTSLSSLVRMAPKMTPPISPELPVYARVSGAALCFRRRLLFYCALMPLCQVAFCSIVTEPNVRWQTKAILSNEIDFWPNNISEVLSLMSFVVIAQNAIALRAWHFYPLLKDQF
jgi:hypothetical protein